MEAAPELRSLVDAAEQAAAGGDHASAERLLRDALRLQEASLGPQHPDLANTLNNLGVVYEMAGKPADAEECYRRAHEIATASLAPDHPFVATSRQNLEDFCKTRGIPVEKPVAAVPEARTAPPRRAAPVPQAARPASISVPAPPPAIRSVRRLVIAALVVGGLALAIFVVVRPDVSSTGPAAPSSSAPLPQEQTPAPSSEPAPVEPPRPPRPTAAAPNDRAATADTPAAKATGPAPTVVSAQLCRNAPRGEWRCDPVSGPLDPATLFFYTRIASPRDTIVQHRWYQGERLHQSIDLRVQASQGGYRTYSRSTVSAGRGSDWRVELRGQDGSVLREERFSVR